MHRQLIPDDSTIMCIDDDPACLQMLGEMLQVWGYKVRAFRHSDAAWTSMCEVPPDLILLDVNMPGINGFDLCERIKATPSLEEIPILFVSGRGDMSGKIRAFECGALDFIQKPFQFGEVRVRVENHLKLRRAGQLLAERHEDLRASYERLNELERLRDSLIHMVVHDLRNNLTVISGYLQLLDIHMHALINTKGRRDLDMCNLATHDMLEMVSSLLDVNKMENDRLELYPSRVDLNELVSDVVTRYELVTETRQIELKVDVAPGLNVSVDRDLIRRVLTNLLTNATKYTPKLGQIGLSAERDGDHAVVRVRDSGPGIDPKNHALIFEKFGRVQQDAQAPLTYGTGLGLTFCKMVVERHGGEIRVDSKIGHGAVFSIHLPLVQ